MITRLVKMEFRKDEIKTFMEIFQKTQSKIKAMDGCMSLHLHQDIHEQHTFFTISTWRTEQDLENYRASNLFRETWQSVKPLFKNKAMAWSLNS